MNRLIVTAAAPSWEQAIAQAAEPDYRVRACRTAVELFDTIRESSPEAVFLDPVLLGNPAALDDCMALQRRMRSVAYFCVSLTTPDAASMLATQELEPARLFLAEDGVDAARIARALAELPAERAALGVANALDLSLGHAPHRLRAVIGRMIRRPEEFFAVDDIARNAGMSRRNVDRLLNGVGIASGRRLVIAVRVLHAVVRIVEQRRSVTATAASLGYANRVVLTRHIKGVLGCKPSEIATGIDDPAVGQAVRRFIEAGADGAARIPVKRARGGAATALRSAR